MIGFSTEAFVYIASNIDFDMVKVLFLFAAAGEELKELFHELQWKSFKVFKFIMQYIID